MKRRSSSRGQTPRPTVALGGAGAIAVVHALAADAAGLRVIAVASRRGSSARHLAGNIDARKVSIDALPAGADILVVATPPEAHESLALQGLTAGSRVLVEKPLTTTLASADRIIESCSSHPERLRVAENLLHSPIWRTAIGLRPSMGALTHLSARAVQPPPEWGHFLEPLSTGGVLFDLGPHPLALLLDLADSDPVAVTASLTSTREDRADDHAEVSLRFASGLVADLETSWIAPDVHWAVQASSDDAVLRLELNPEPLVEFNGEELVPEYRHDVPDIRLESLGYVDQLLDLADLDPPLSSMRRRCIGGDSSAQSARVGQTAEQARDVLEVICAAYAAAGTGGEVALPFTGDRGSTPMQLWRGG